MLHLLDTVGLMAAETLCLGEGSPGLDRLPGASVCELPGLFLCCICASSEFFLCRQQHRLVAQGVMGAIAGQHACLECWLQADHYHAFRGQTDFLMSGFVFVRDKNGMWQPCVVCEMGDQHMCQWVATMVNKFGSACLRHKACPLQASSRISR